MKHCAFDSSASHWKIVRSTQFVGLATPHVGIDCTLLSGALPISDAGLAERLSVATAVGSSASVLCVLNDQPTRLSAYAWPAAATNASGPLCAAHSCAMPL